MKYSLRSLMIVVTLACVVTMLTVRTTRLIGQAREHGLQHVHFLSIQFHERALRGNEEESAKGLARIR